MFRTYDLIATVFLFSLLFLGGCATQGVGLPASQTLQKETDAKATPQDYIDEAKKLATTVALTVAQQRSNGIITDAERDSYVTAIKKWRDDLNKAQLLLNAGDPASARQRAQTINAAILTLQRELAKRNGAMYELGNLNIAAYYAPRACRVSAGVGENQLRRAASRPYGESRIGNAARGITAVPRPTTG